jgi:hypothetical protein
MDCSSLFALPTPGRPWRLRIDAGDIVASARERDQARDCKMR